MAATEFDVPWLPSLEEAPAATVTVKLHGNQARKGDKDFGAPGATAGHGLPKNRGASGQHLDPTKHPRGGKGTQQGGEFVKAGDTGTMVDAVQKDLGMAPTGTYDAGTAATVAAFQKRHGLAVDGIIGRQTALALSGQYARARRTTPGSLGKYTRKLVGGDSKPRGKKTAGSKSKGERVGGGLLIAADEDHLAEGFNPNEPRAPGGQPGGGRWVKRGAGWVLQGTPSAPASASIPEVKLKKVARGYYASEDGRYAVMVDGYNPSRTPEQNDEHGFGFGGEWAAIHDRNGQLRRDATAGENLDWFPTKRDAVEAVQSHARRNAPRPPTVKESSSLLDDLLQESGLEASWDESLHPRDLLGKFIRKIDKLTPRGQAGPSYVTLPDGTRVSKDADGTFRVVRSGRIVGRLQTPRSAAFEAISRSGRATDPASVGGAQRLSPAALAATFDVSNLANADTYAQMVANLQDELARARHLANTGDQYAQRALPNIEAHLNLVRAEARNASGPAPAAHPLADQYPVGRTIDIGQNSTTNFLSGEIIGHGTPVNPTAEVVRVRLPSGAVENLAPREIERVLPAQSGHAAISPAAVTAPAEVIEPFRYDAVGMGDVVVDSSNRRWKVTRTGLYTSSGGVNRSRAISVRPVEGGRARTMGIGHFRSIARRSAGTGAITPPAAAAPPRRYDQAAPGEPTLRGNIFGVERELPVARVTRGTDDANYHLRTRDKIGIARFPTGNRTYATHINFTSERYWTDRGQATPSRYVPHLVTPTGETFYMDSTFYLLNRNTARIFGIHGDGARGAVGNRPPRPGMRASASTSRSPGGNPPSFPVDRPYGRVESGELTPAAPAAASPAPAASAASAAVGRDIIPGNRLLSNRIADMVGMVPRHVGTRITGAETHGGYIYLRGEDGRTWSIEAARAASDVAASVQVRTQSGHPHTAPGMVAALTEAPAISGVSQPVNAARAHPAAPEGSTVAHGASRSGPSAAIPPPSQQAAIGSAPRIRAPAGNQEHPDQRAAREGMQGIVDALHGFSHDGYTTKINHVTAGGYEGVVLDPNGRQVGAFGRSVKKVPTGNPPKGGEIYHSIFQIEANHRASGYGTKLVEKMFESYKANGFDTVTVSAGLDVGGYQWAKMGFEFNHPDPVRYVKQFVEGYSAKLNAPVREGLIPQALVDEFKRQVEEGMITSPSQIAAWGRRTTWTVTRGGKEHTMWLGKALLLGSGWAGKKKL